MSVPSERRGEQALLTLVPRDDTVRVADLTVAGRYLPVGGGAGPIAGDFYDVLTVGPDLVMIAVGDVTGHGTAAAGRMVQLRAATRAYALDDPSPCAVLARLDRMLDRIDSDGLATLWYATYQPSTGRLVYASAGHPPPVITCHGGPSELLRLASAPPLGTGLAHQVAVEEVTVLAPGAVLVAYSDGLVERPDQPLDQQLALLRGLVAGACDPDRPRDPESIAALLLRTLVPAPQAAADDVCLLVLRRQRPEEPLRPGQPGLALVTPEDPAPAG